MKKKNGPRFRPVLRALEGSRSQGTALVKRLVYLQLCLENAVCMLRQAVVTDTSLCSNVNYELREEYWGMDVGDRTDRD